MSDCRGVARGANPNRSQSYRDVWADIISIAQQASPNVMNHMLERRDQL
jgi:hypothetical protein